MATSKIYELTKEVKECESKVSTLLRKKEDAKKELDELLNKNFYHLRDFIAKALYEEFGDEQKQKIDKKNIEDQKKEEQRKLMKDIGVKNDEDWLNISMSYSIDSIFDPFVDKFEILDCTLSEDKKSIKIRVECLKNRQYLGITGYWIPSTYETGWLPIKDVIEAENSTSFPTVSL